jgi:hypothetical protein
MIREFFAQVRWSLGRKVVRFMDWVRWNLHGRKVYAYNEKYDLTVIQEQSSHTRRPPKIWDVTLFAKSLDSTGR